MLLALASSLWACGNKAKESKPGQTLTSVDGHEITIIFLLEQTLVAFLRIPATLFEESDPTVVELDFRVIDTVHVFAKAGHRETPRLIGGKLRLDLGRPKTVGR